MAQNENLAELSAAGVAVWLDDLSRDRIRSGNLQQLVDEHSVVGVTTNPTIFAAAISGSDVLRRPAARPGRPRGERRGGAAHDHRRRRPRTPATCCARSHDRQPRRRPGLPRGRTRARARHRRAPRPRPGTCGGWSTGPTSSSRSRRPRPACRRSPTTHRQGHQRQRHPDLQPRALPARSWTPTSPAWSKRVAERRLARRHRLGRVVLRLPRGHRDRQAPRRGRRRRRRSRARPASPTPSWPTRPTRRSSPPTAGRRSRPKGAVPQRPLWASTGVKNPEYSDTMYIVELIAPGTVNTMPEKTLMAYADHGTPGHAGPEGLRRRRGDDAGRRRRRRRPRRRLPGRSRTRACRSSSTPGTS